MEVVAFNDLVDRRHPGPSAQVRLILGRLGQDVTVVDGGIQVGDKVIKSFAERTRPRCRGARSAPTW